MSDLVSVADGVVAVSATDGTDINSWSASPRAPLPAMDAWGKDTDGIVNTDDTGASGDWVDVADSITSCNIKNPCQNMRLSAIIKLQK